MLRPLAGQREHHQHRHPASGRGAAREQLVARGWAYHDGFDGPPGTGRFVSECYPYTTLVGVAELGYHHDGQRPRYKRKPKRCPTAQWRPVRAAACDELVCRLVGLEAVDPPLRLRSHPFTGDLLTPSPLDDRVYKHREDLIDAVTCAWTAALWHRHGLTRCQVLGLPNPNGTPAATIIAPMYPRVVAALAGELSPLPERWDRSDQVSRSSARLDDRMGTCQPIQ